MMQEGMCGEVDAEVLSKVELRNEVEQVMGGAEWKGGRWYGVE